MWFQVALKKRIGSNQSKIIKYLVSFKDNLNIYILKLDKYADLKIYNFGINIYIYDKSADKNSGSTIFLFFIIRWNLIVSLVKT